MADAKAITCQQAPDTLGHQSIALEQQNPAFCAIRTARRDDFGLECHAGAKCKKPGACAPAAAADLAKASYVPRRHPPGEL